MKVRRQNFIMAEDTRENDIALTHLHIQKKGTEACWSINISNHVTRVLTVEITGG